MIKRIVVFILITALLLSFAGCGMKKVPKPTAVYPDYTFAEAPDTDDLRQTAVRAMRDLLSIQWFTKVDYRYYKTGPASKKQYIFEPGNIYAGVLYTNANTGLFQFLEYYNPDTGEFVYPHDADTLKTELGVSCADAVLWAWSTVCTSISGGFYPKSMVIKNGYYPVGPYTYDPNTRDFNYLPTLNIVRDNGEEIMFESYAQVRMADALTTSSDNHAMMAIEDAHVEYLADGRIDGENSYILIQDQRAGGKNWQRTDEQGNILHYSGRLDGQFSFTKLFEEHFIPVTAAEFIGEKEYEKAEISVSEKCSSPDQLQNITIESNYPLAVLNVIATQSGKETVIHKELFGGGSERGVPHSIALSEITELKDSKYQTPGTMIQIEVVVATGERFTPIEITV